MVKGSWLMTIMHGSWSFFTVHGFTLTMNDEL